VGAGIAGRLRNDASTVRAGRRWPSLSSPENPGAAQAMVGQPAIFLAYSAIP